MKICAMAVCAVLLGTSAAFAQLGPINSDCELDITEPMRAGYLAESPLIDLIAGPEDQAGRVCIAIPDDDAFGGVVDARDIFIRTTKRAVEWRGEWTHYGARLTISTGAKGGWIYVDGYAEYGADDPERVANGSVNVGGFYVETLIDPLDPTYTEFGVQGETAIPYQEAEEFDCKVRMRRVGRWIWMVDNGMCGGHNVSFTGVYSRTP